LEEVFDRLTLMTIYDLMNAGALLEFYGVISAGKESRIYLAKGPEGFMAVKIYLITSAEFKKTRMTYVVHDPRFKRIPSDFRDFIYLWAKREFGNLKKAYEAGVPVPKPYFVENNVLGMQFLGKDGMRYPTLEEAELEPSDYEKIYPLILENIKRLYQKADLIHADMSQYNVFVTDTLSIYFIDLSQAVHTSHPLAEVFLERDVRNITKFFEKKGIKVRPPEEVIEWIKS
jgi:RIO kinase 1